MAAKIEVDSSSIAGLRQQLIALKGELAAATDPAQMQKLAQAAGQVQDKLNDVNEQVKTFAAGTQFEVAKNSLSGFGSAIADLDFEKATQQANAFSGAVKGFNLSSLSNGIKGLGTSFATLGKALITNPIFVIGAVITAVTVAVIALLNKLGLLKPILDSIKSVLGFLTQAFDDFTDALGLTTNATDKLREAEKKLNEQRKKDITRRLDAELQLQEAIQGLNAEEIKILEKKLGREIDTSKSIFEVREQGLKDLKKIEDDRFNELQALELKQGKLTEEQIAEKNKAEEESDKLKDLLLANDIERGLAEIEAGRKTSEAEKKRLEDGVKNREQAAAKAKALTESQAREGLDLLRDQNELELLSAQETGAQRLAIVEQQGEEEAKFLRDNAVALGLITKQGDDTRLQLAVAAIEKRVQKEREATKQLEEEKIAAIAAAIQEREKIELKTAATIANNEVTNAQFALDNFKGTTEERLVLIEQVKNAVIAATEAEKQAKLNAIQDEIDALQNAPTGETPEAQAARLAKIAEFEAQKKVIEDEARNAKTQAELDAEEQIRTARTETAQKAVEDIQQYVDAAGQTISDVSGIVNNIFDAQNERREQANQAELAGLKEGSEAYKNAKARQAAEDDKYAERQFNINKSLQIASAVVAGLQSVLAITSVPDFTLGVASALRIAAQAALTASTVAKIKATKYQKGGGGSAPPSTPPSPPLPSIGASGGGAATPAVNLFGQGNNQNTVTATAQPVTPNMTVTAVVSETDITSTQERVARMRRSAEL